MPIPLRGWARPRSVAARLAACEQLIGHNFSNVDLLLQALDVRESMSRRLAIVGDKLVECHLAHRWWEKKDLSGVQWTDMRTSVLSNENLSNVGFRMGINECTLPEPCEHNMTIRMATAIEAVLAAVWLDTNRDSAALEKIIDRFGLTHSLLDAGTERAWLHRYITSSRILPHGFFSGHYLELIKASSELKQPMIPPRDLTSEDAKPTLGEALFTQKTKTKQSGAQEVESIHGSVKKLDPESRNSIARVASNTWLRLRYTLFGNDVKSHVSRQVSPIKHPSHKVPRDAEQPNKTKSNEGIEMAQDDRVPAQVSRDQVAKLSASFEMDVAVKKSGKGSQETARDEVVNSKAEPGDPVAGEDVEQGLSDARSGVGDTKRLQVQDMEPTAHDETEPVDQTSPQKGSAEDVTVGRGSQSSERNYHEDYESASEKEREDREEQMRKLQKRIEKLTRKQSAKSDAARLEVLQEAIAQLDALKK